MSSRSDSDRAEFFRLMENYVHLGSLLPTHPATDFDPDDASAVADARLILAAMVKAAMDRLLAHASD
jgi:hypothetical protein